MKTVRTQMPPCDLTASLKLGNRVAFQWTRCSCSSKTQRVRDGWWVHSNVANDNRHKTVTAELRGRMSAFPYSACTNRPMVLRALSLTLNICRFQVIVNCLEICRSVNSFNHLLPPRKDDIELRPAGHDFLLPICNYELRRRSFVVRCIINFF